MIGMQFDHSSHHGAAHLIARKHLVDEPIAIDVTNQCAMAAQRLGQERTRHSFMMQCGGVKLHEFHIGNGSSGSQCHRYPVSGCFKRIGCHRENLAGTTGGKKNVSSPDIGKRTIGQRRSDSDTAAVLDHEIKSKGVFVNLRCFAAHRRNKCSLNFGAGCNTTSVHDSRKRVAALSGEFKLTIGITIEPRTESHKITNPDRTFLNKHPNSVDVTQAGSGSQRVSQMQIGGIGITAEHCGDTALGPTSR
jgi:hypothetical protein